MSHVEVTVTVVVRDGHRVDAGAKVGVFERSLSQTHGGPVGGATTTLADALMDDTSALVHDLVVTAFGDPSELEG